MNNSTKFVVRSIAGGIIGLAAGQVVQGIIRNNNWLTKQAISEDAFSKRMDAIRNTMLAPQTLAERIAEYTEAELFWILDRHDDKVADLDADVQMAEADEADELAMCEPSWAMPGTPIRARIDATNEHIRSAWGSTDGCTIVGCPICAGSKENAS